MNLIEQAARLDDVTAAHTLLRERLGIASPKHAGECLPWQSTWGKLPIAQRLMELGNWLRSECIDLMDAVEIGPAKIGAAS